MEKHPAIYILSNTKRGALYIGVTSNLLKRVWQHKNHQVDGFSHRYQLTRLVYFEISDDMHSAISREKQLKWWRRQWKIDLIEEGNPEWADLWDVISR